MTRNPSKKLEVEASKEVNPVVEVAQGRRVTRSLTRPRDSVDGSAAALQGHVNHPRKKVKVKAVVNQQPVASEVENKSISDKSITDEEIKKKTLKGDVGASESKTRTIIVEYCKQCRAFKQRAEQVMSGLKAGVSGIVVLLNPEKPRRGYFEIREEGGETFISLPNMKRPFKPMKDLDMEQVILDIIGKIQA